MITIFHGDDLAASRLAFSQFLDQNSSKNRLHFNSKTIDLDRLNNFVSGGSLFSGNQLLIIDNLFSLPKPIFDKISQIINQNKQVELVLWQDKNLTAAQLKTFPSAVNHCYKADNQIYSCLNAIKPHNLILFNQLYDQIIDQELFDLFLYLLKNSLRRQLQTYSRFSQSVLKKIYLQLIELEYQYKSGQLALPKESALKRVLLPLLK